MLTHRQRGTLPALGHRVCLALTSWPRELSPAQSAAGVWPSAAHADRARSDADSPGPRGMPRGQGRHRASPVLQMVTPRTRD